MLEGEAHQPAHGVGRRLVFQIEPELANADLPVDVLEHG